MNAVIAHTKELELAAVKAQESGLSTEGVASLAAAFSPHYQTVSELVAKASQVGQDQPKEARAVRLALVTARTSSDKTREALKKDILLKGNAIQGFHNILLASVAPIEKAMDDIEKAEARKAAEVLRLLQESRSEELRPYADPAIFSGMNLAGMTTEAWSSFLQGQKSAFEAEKARLAAEQVKAEQEAKERAEAKVKAEQKAVAERERMRAENERLAKVAAEEKAKREAAEKEAKAELEKQQAYARIERERQEAIVAKERAEAARIAAIEKEKRETAERELAKIEADKQAAIEAKALAEEAAKAAPDKEKLAALVESIKALKVPTLSSAKGDALATKISEQIGKLITWIETQSTKI